MYKALCVAALLWAMFALTTPTLASGLPSPVIVAKGKWTRQTAPIPTTTLFTPTQDGLYRLSIYATLTTADSSSQTYWYVNVFWTDDEGPQSFYDVLFAWGNQPGQFGQFQGILGSVNPISGPALVFEGKAGQPINYSVGQQGSPDNSAYSLYYVLERLE